MYVSGFPRKGRQQSERRKTGGRDNSLRIEDFEREGRRRVWHTRISISPEKGYDAGYYGL